MKNEMKMCSPHYVEELNENYKFHEHYETCENCEKSQFSQDLQLSEYWPNLWLKRLNENTTANYTKITKITRVAKNRNFCRICLICS